MLKPLGINSETQKSKILYYEVVALILSYFQAKPQNKDICQICLLTNDDCALRYHFVPFPLIGQYRGLEQKAYQEIYKPYFGSIVMVNTYSPKVI